MTVEKKKIINKEKCDKIINDIYKDKKFFRYLHKVMINTYNEYNGLDKVIDLDDFKGECFLKIYKSLDLYDSKKGTIKNFCINCIKSTALQELRKGRSVKNRFKNKDYITSLNAYLDDDGECSLNDIIPGKDDEYFYNDLEEKIMDLINTILSPRERESMIMRIEGYKTSEIAEILNTSSNNITNRLAKARNKLRKYLN